MIIELCNKEFQLGKYKYKCDDAAGHNGRHSQEMFRVILYDDGETLVNGRKIGE